MKAKLTIVMLSPVLGDAFGQEKVMRESTRLLRADGHRVLFLGDRIAGAVPENDGLKLIPGISSLSLTTSPVQVARYYHEVERFLSSVNPDVVHLIDQFDWRVQKALCRDYRVVVTSHLLATTCPSSTRLTGAGTACTKKSGYACLWHHRSYGCLSHFRGVVNRGVAVTDYLLRRQSLKEARVIGAVSRYVEQALLADGWDPTKVFWIPNPIAPAKAIPPYFDAPSPLITCVSRLEKYKGIELLLRALHTIKKEKWTFWLCGEGSQRKAIEQLIVDLDLTARVRLWGRTGYDETKRMVAASDMLIQSNIGPEAFGLSAAEASAQGVPVVAADIPALNEIIEHGKNGLLFQPGDAGELSRAIHKLLSDPELRFRLSQGGPELVESRFSEKIHLTRTLLAYRQALGSSSPERMPIRKSDTYALSEA